MSTADQRSAEKSLAITVRAPAAVESSGVRASDAERDAVVAALYRALGDGRLDVAETDMRVAQAYAARFRSDLQSILNDLPDDRPGPGAGSSTASSRSTLRSFWALLAWRARAVLLAAVLGLLVLGGVGGAALGEPGGDGAAFGHHLHGQDFRPASGQ